MCNYDVCRAAELAPVPQGTTPVSVSKFAWGTVVIVENFVLHTYTHSNWADLLDIRDSCSVDVRDVCAIPEIGHGASIKVLADT